MKNAQLSIKKFIDHCLLIIVHSQSGIAAILIIAGVIIVLAILATLLKFSSVGPSNIPTSQVPKPTTTAIAQAQVTPTPILDASDQCSLNDLECSEDTGSEFSGEGDGVKASDLDGEG